MTLFTGRFQTTLALLMVLVALASALPQQQQRGQDPRAIQRRPQQQQQPQRAEQRPATNTAKLPQGSLALLPANTKLSALNETHMNDFLSNEASVRTLSNCLVEPKRCTDRSAMNLITQIKRLGKGGSCSSCSPEEQERVNDLVYRFISGYQTKYPDYWRQVVPSLGNVLSGR